MSIHFFLFLCPFILIISCSLLSVSIFTIYSFSLEHIVLISARILVSCFVDRCITHDNGSVNHLCDVSNLACISLLFIGSFPIGDHASFCDIMMASPFV